MSAENLPLCFIDSNIWLYMFLPEQNMNKAKIATQLLQGKKTQVTVSTQVVNEVINVIIRKHGLPEDQIRDLIVSFYENYLVVHLDNTIQVNASFLREKYSLSHWDSLIVSTALSTGASILYTEDMQHGLIVNEQLTLINPFK